MYHKLVYDTYMPHVSRNKLSKTLENRLITTFNTIIAKTIKEDDTDKLLKALLTPTEQIMLAKRIAIIVLLKEGLPDSQIAQNLHVTRMTVSRLRYYFEARGEGFEIALKVLRHEKVMKEFTTELLKIAGYAARAAGGRVKPTII